MKMKWSIVLMGLLGLVAACCAAVLTASMQARPVTQAVQLSAIPVKMLVAAQAVEPMSVVQSDAVKQVTVQSGEAPAGYYSDPSQVVGRVIAFATVEGQPFTRGLFAAEGSGMHLAGVLPPGKRAVAISLSDYSSLEGLLYAGSRVDVLASFDISSASKMGKAVSTTLIENVEVLAIEGITVAASEGDETSAASTTSGKAQQKKKAVVTLMVDSKQGEALQLAMENGRITLALRNPHDEVRLDGDATLLSGGRLASLAKAMDSTVGAGEEPAKEPEKPTEPPKEEKPSKPAPKPVPTVTVDVIRGVSTQSVSFPYPRQKG